MIASLPGLKTVYLSTEREGGTSVFLPLLFSKLFTKLLKCPSGMDHNVVRSQ